MVWVWYSYCTSIDPMEVTLAVPWIVWERADEFRVVSQNNVSMQTIDVSNPWVEDFSLLQRNSEHYSFEDAC